MATGERRYSDEELNEFRDIINEKLALARRDYKEMMAQLTNANSNDVIDTSPTYKALEEGSEAQSKEEIIQMAQRQQKFIKGLEAALVLRGRPHDGRVDTQGASPRRSPCYVERCFQERQKEQVTP